MNLHVSTLFGAFSCLPAAFFWTAFNRLQFYQPHIVVVHGGAVYCSAMQTILLFIMPQILGYIQSIPTILSHYIYILGQCLFSVSQNHTVCVQYFTFAFLVQYSTVLGIGVRLAYEPVKCFIMYMHQRPPPLLRTSCSLVCRRYYTFIIRPWSR